MSDVKVPLVVSPQSSSVKSGSPQPTSPQSISVKSTSPQSTPATETSESGEKSNTTTIVIVVIIIFIIIAVIIGLCIGLYFYFRKGSTGSTGSTGTTGATGITGATGSCQYYEKGNGPVLITPIITTNERNRGYENNSVPYIINKTYPIYDAINNKAIYYIPSNGRQINIKIVNPLVDSLQLKSYNMDTKICTKDFSYNTWSFDPNSVGTILDQNLDNENPNQYFSGQFIKWEIDNKSGKKYNKEQELIKLDPIDGTKYFYKVRVSEYYNPDSDNYEVLSSVDCGKISAF